MLSPADRRHSAGAGANRYGAISDTIIPVSLKFGKDGAQLDCRIRRDYAISSDPDYLHESLAGYWATLEYRPNSNNRALQTVLFRGVVSSESYQHASQENGVDVTFWDRLALADNVVEMYTGYYPIGTVLSMIDAMDIWPEDTDGNRLGGIDPALFERRQWGGMLSIDGIPTPQAFAMLFQNQKKDVVDIDYQGGKMLLTTRQRGAEEVDLVVGRIKATVGTKVYEVDIKDLRGVKDYSRVVTRLVGRGDITQRADTYSLTPAWDRSLDDVVLEDPSLPDTNPGVYGAVGRLYLVPAAFWPYNAESGGTGSGYDPVLWARRSSDYDWVPIENDGEIVRDETGFVHPLTGKSQMAYTDGASRLYRFNSTQICRYYTQAQEVQRRAGEFVEPTATFAELELTATFQDSVLAYDTGFRGDLPIRRTRLLKNQEYSRLTVGQFFRAYGTQLQGRVSASPPTFDHTGALVNECEDAIDVISQPAMSFTAALTRCNFNLKRGMKVRNMYDRDGDLVFENLGWFIESIDYTFNTLREGSYTASVSFDGAAEDLLGGVVLS
jgi:hypothetical protein